MKCIICGKKAVECYSPDMDIKGICACKKHKEKVKLAYIALVQGNKKIFTELTGKRL